MTHLAASLFFALVLLGAAVAIHMSVRIHWARIVSALRGELGREITPPVQAARAATRRPHAAF